jgi:hypothetical protein
MAEQLNIDRREQVLIKSLATYLVERELRDVRRSVQPAGAAKEELVDRLHTAIEQALEDEVEALSRELEPFK